MKDDQKFTSTKFRIEQIYTKNVLFKVGRRSSIFKEKWNPKLNVNFDTKVESLSGVSVYEITLTIKVNASFENNPNFFKIDIQQAGIFIISDVTDTELNHAKYAFCPSILYPYAREVVSCLVSKGGFPNLYLAPLNFDFIYKEKQKREEFK